MDVYVFVTGWKYPISQTQSTPRLRAKAVRGLLAGAIKTFEKTVAELRTTLDIHETAWDIPEAEQPVFVGTWKQLLATPKRFFSHLELPPLDPGGKRRQLDKASLTNQVEFLVYCTE